jgi:hypothetical protein
MLKLTLTGQPLTWKRHNLQNCILIDRNGEFCRVSVALAFSLGASALKPYNSYTMSHLRALTFVVVAAAAVVVVVEVAALMEFAGAFVDASFADSES